MNLSSLKSLANGSSSIFEIDIPDENPLLDSKLFPSKLYDSWSSINCFRFRILFNNTTSNDIIIIAAIATQTEVMITVLISFVDASFA